MSTGFKTEIPIQSGRLGSLVKLDAMADDWQEARNPGNARRLRGELHNYAQLLLFQGTEYWPAKVYRSLCELDRHLERGGSSSNFRRDAVLYAFGALEDMKHELYSLRPSRRITPSEVDAKALKILKANGTPWFEHISCHKAEKRFQDEKWRCYLQVNYVAGSKRELVWWNDYPLERRDFAVPRVEILADVAAGICRWQQECR